MLLLKKAEIEQALAAEMQRIRMIESRLQAIRAREDGVPLNVVIKQITAQPVVSVRSIFDNFESAMVLLGQIRMALPEKSGYGLSFCICHDEDAKDHDMDLEMGRLIEATSHLPVPLSDALILRPAELPAAMMATTVVTGALETIHTGYAEIALWIETNGYRLAGTPREITLAFPRKAGGSDLVTEIQFPVEALQA
jgi:effector-binding domain-containing protein